MIWSFLYAREADAYYAAGMSVSHKRSFSYLLNYKSEPRETLYVGLYPVQLQEYEENFLNFLPVFFFWRFFSIEKK